MQDLLKRFLQAVLLITISVPVCAGEEKPASGSASAAAGSSVSGATMKVEGDAALNPALLGILVMKGVLTKAEANALQNVPSASGVPQLLNLLKEKGVVTDADLVQVNLATAVPANAVVQTTSSYNAQATTPPAPAQEPAVIPAVTPLRVLPIDLPKQGGMIPDIKLGSGGNMKIYGFLKATAVSDTASSGGATFGSNDFPLPLLLGGDTGPTSDPQFHIKARSFRIGSLYEWVPKGSNLTLTGRVEGDFEADYTDVNNRNISSARSSQFGIRLAYMRLDTKLGTLPWFAEFGQDWLLISSTLPNLFETTGLALGMGALWERSPLFKTGVQFHSGDLKVQPEFAIVLPVAGTSTLTADQRARFGDRAGAESNQPALESRLVFQFPLSHHWKAVAPAQVIFSGHHARMNEIIPHAAQVATSVTCTVLPCTVTTFYNPNVPNIGFTTANRILNAPNCATVSGICNLEQLFPKGTQRDYPQNVWTAEIQLPTPWVTFDAKFYRGDNMRFFFGGQFDDVYSSLHGLFEVGSGVSFSGRAILFGCAGGTTAGQPAATIDCRGTLVLASNLQPIGGSGGFAEMSFPLSRIFHANPEGYNGGWVLHTTYGTDRANYADASHTATHLGRTDLDTVALNYRLNKWVSFVHEASYIVTFTANNHSASGAITPQYLPFAGGVTRQAHNWRNEFGPVFTF
jgi:hypothetical protein